MNNSQEFNSIKIKSFRLGEKLNNSYKLIKYHYTSPQALLSILGSSQDDLAYLRFTDIRYMNDKSEQVYFVKILLEFLDEHRADYPRTIEIVNDLLLNDGYSHDDYTELKISEIHYAKKYDSVFGKRRSFIFCTCEKNDLLNMWNYYIKNGNYQGYNIGIEIYPFLKSFDVDINVIANEPIEVKYGAVLYGKNEQEIEIKTLVEQIENSVFSDLDIIAPNGVEYPFQQINLRNYIDTYGCFFKDSNFLSEKEYRILFSVDNTSINNLSEYCTNSNNKKIKFDFYERNGILVPYLKVPLVKKAVKSITMAPTTENEIAKNSLNEFLSLNGYKADILSSNIPIRF